MPLANPEVTASLRPAGVTVGLAPERLLFVGQHNGGTAVSGALVENVGDDMSVLAAEIGDDSPLYAALARARRRNKETRMDYIALTDNGGGTDATGAVVFGGGPATAAGTITVYIGSKKINAYELAVAIGDTATDIGDALVAALTADNYSLVTGVNTTGSVALTAKNAGTFGNTIGIKIEGSAEAITVAVTAMSGGATDPVLTGVFDVIDKERYQGIVWQYDQDLTELTDFLDPRFNVTNNVLDGVGFVGLTDTYANLLTTLGLENSENLSLNVDKLIDETDHRGPAILELPFVKVAEFAAIRALRRTDEATLGSLVISRSPRDSFGGPWQNSKPYFNTPFPDLLVPDSGDSFTDQEISDLLDAGGWVIDANRPFTEVIAGPVVTTYKTDSAGNPDPTWGFLNYRDTASAVREYIVNNTRSKYPQYRATGGALLNQVDSANEASVAAFVTELYADLGDFGLVNTGVGTVSGETVDYDKLFREGLTVTLNPVTGKFFVSFNAYIVVQLRGVTYDIAIAFEV